MFLIVIIIVLTFLPFYIPIALQRFFKAGNIILAKQSVFFPDRKFLGLLANTEVICSEKSGMQTESEISVAGVYAGRQMFRVSGQFILNDEPVQVRHFPDLISALNVGMLANSGNETNTLDQALLNLANLGGLPIANRDNDYPLVSEIPYLPEQRWMAQIRETPEGAFTFIKGALETLLVHAVQVQDKGQIRVITPEDRALMQNTAIHFGHLGLGVIALGFTPQATPDNPFCGLVLVGLIAYQQTVRAAMKSALAEADQLGLTTILMTGDQKSAAMAHAKATGFCAAASQVRSGEELEALSDSELGDQLREIRVGYRMSFLQKSRVIDAWKNQGKSVIHSSEATARFLGTELGYPALVTAIRVSRFVLTHSQAYVRQALAGYLACGGLTLMATLLVPRFETAILMGGLSQLGMLAFAEWKRRSLFEIPQ